MPVRNSLTPMDMEWMRNVTPARGPALSRTATSFWIRSGSREKSAEKSAASTTSLKLSTG